MCADKGHYDFTAARQISGVCRKAKCAAKGHYVRKK